MLAESMWIELSSRCVFLLSVYFHGMLNKDKSVVAYIFLEYIPNYFLAERVATDGRVLVHVTQLEDIVEQ